MSVIFHKMHGAGNDFVLLDLRHQDFELDPQHAAMIADRKRGIGCDKILRPLGELLALVEQVFVLPGLLFEALSCQVGKPFIWRFAASGHDQQQGCLQPAH